MANSTKFLMAEQVLLRLAGGYRDVAQSVQMEDVVKAIEQVINTMFQTQYYSATLPTGETVPDNLMIAFNIINSSIKTKVGKILFFGSSCIYPQFCKLPISEDSLLTGLVEKNNESFAIAKIAAIKLMQSFEKEFPKNKIDFRCRKIECKNSKWVKS